MAVIYLRSSDGGDGSNGLTWADAKATLANALSAAGAGGTVYVSKNHAETGTPGVTLTSPGTASAPVTVICVDDTGDPEPPTTLATTATVTRTGNASITFVGFAYVYGVIFNAGSGTSGTPGFVFNAQTPWWWRFERCKLVIPHTGTSAGVRIVIGANATATDDQLLELIESDIEFSHASHCIGVRAPFRWLGGSLLGTAPTVLFNNNSTGVINDAILYGINLAIMESSSTLVDVSVANSAFYVLENCKLGSSVVMTTGTNPGQGGPELILINCDSADTNYRYYKSNYNGTISHETTIVRTGGSSNGTTTFSRLMTSSANTKIYNPLILGDLIIWNESTGSPLTARIELVTDNVTLTNADIYGEVEYLGTSGFPLSLFANSRISNHIFGTPTNLTTSSVTWTTTGLTTPVKQYMEVTFTPQEKGPVKIRVYLTKASTSVYVDTKVTLGSTSSRQWMVGTLLIQSGNESSSVVTSNIFSIINNSFIRAT